MLSGLRMSWSVSTISNSGSSRAREKCFSAAVYPTLAGALAGM